MLEGSNSLLKNIITQKPFELLNISNNIDKKYSFLKSEKDIILDIFDYTNFRGSEAAYWFGKNINSNVCPYCNREHTFTYRTKDEQPKLLYDLDHFFDKANYPYLSLSFYYDCFGYTLCTLCICLWPLLRY